MPPLMYAIDWGVKRWRAFSRGAHFRKSVIMYAYPIFNFLPCPSGNFGWTQRIRRSCCLKPMSCSLLTSDCGAGSDTYMSYGQFLAGQWDLHQGQRQMDLFISGDWSWRTNTWLQFIETLYLAASRLLTRSWSSPERRHHWNPADQAPQQYTWAASAFYQTDHQTDDGL